MDDVIRLLKPRWQAVKNSGRRRQGQTGRGLKLAVLTGIGLLFWIGLFSVSVRVLLYFKGVEDIGDILADKLLSMMVITSFALLIFSSILTALSKLYLSRDLHLVHALPVSTYKVFLARWIDSTIDSSWMVLIYTLPVFVAYGVVHQSGPLFFISLGLLLPALAVNASAISVLLVMVAVMIVPASRMKNIFIFLSLLFFVVLYLAIRMVKPELLVDPEVFDTVMFYITSLQTPSSPVLPSTWVYDGLHTMLNGSAGQGLFHIALCWSFAGCMVFLITSVADRFYFKGFSKTQTSPLKRKQPSAVEPYRPSRLLPGPVRALVVKELKVFFRDQTQWSQLFLIGALVVIYLYNFKVLPLEKSPLKTEYLQNLLAFLNMGLALFVLTAVSGRFAYTAVSTEKEAFWFIKSSPSSLKQYLWVKFMVYYLPLLVLTEVLVVATNLLLQVTPLMMGLSTITTFLLVPGIVAMGIGFGAAYPDFKAENPTQTVTSFGGLMFMIICAVYVGIVIVIEAGPVYRLFMADIRNRPVSPYEWAWAAAAFMMVVAMSITAVLGPMTFGAKKLDQHLL